MSKLIDVCEIHGRVGWKGYTVSDLREEGPLVIGANEITSDNQLDLSQVKHLSREKYEESPEIFVLKNDILVVKVGSTIGKVGIINSDIGEASINPNCVIVRAKNINPHYLYYYLCSPQGKAYLINNSAASGQPALNQKDLGNMEIPIISQEKQEKISKILNNINAKVVNNKKIIKEFEKMIKMIYDYWFLQFDFPDENGKPYKSSGGEVKFDDEINRDIPIDWTVKRLDEVVDILDYKRIPLSSAEREKHCKKIYPYYGAQGIIDYVDDYIFEGTYILVAEDGNNLKSKNESIITLASGKFWVNNHAHILGEGCLPLSYMYLYLDKFDVSGLITGSAQPKLNQENLCSIKVLCPPKKLLDNFLKISNAYIQKYIHVINENKELCKLRDFLLPMLINGQVCFEKEGK